MVDAAKGDIQPPGHVKLRDGDQVFWLGVVRARARDVAGDTKARPQLQECAGMSNSGVRFDSPKGITPRAWMSAPATLETAVDRFRAHPQFAGRHPAPSISPASKTKTTVLTFLR